MPIEIPPQYAWLAKEPGPKMVLEGLKLFGTVEAPGAADNPTILGWAKEVGLDGVYRHDATAWCGLTAAVIAQRAGKAIPKDPLWALNWAKFGTKAEHPMLGDVLVFIRPGGGHVGIYLAEGADSFHVLAGNQGDKVSIAPIAKARLFAVRRPIYSIQPSNVRRIVLTGDGEPLSINEA